MGRVIEYFCDACSRKFGDNPHINIKSGNVFISFQKNKDWKVRKMMIPCTEYHFCGPDCLAIWLRPFYEEGLKEVECK